MAEHVTYLRMKVQPGKLDQLRSMMGGGVDEDRIKRMGWRSSTIGARKDDPNEVWGCVVWDNSENYYKNAESPEQNEWFQKMRAVLTADPEWFDCEVIEKRWAQ